ncbi:FAD:protein FMN transferase [Rubritalea profundi]|uniref:FAD:protein FMN transferase n=1 Tax=Rubritalea profundi TaxID=1658618 RepID=A0A2S7U4D7_9BACT|nr:FAD:protein FMN transferase [Rubritalea profundi]PQJ29879.1 hypothetical protein BSZ32_16240 [Rubritalea profundi]
MKTTRRSFLKSASTASLALLFSHCRKSDEAQLFTESERVDSYWSGIGFGIEMSAEWYNVDKNCLPQIHAMIEQTIQELESAFSLYSDSSELSRLNSGRALSNPSKIFTELFVISKKLVERTSGLCQPAIHGAWNAIESKPFSTNWKQRVQAASLDFIQFDGESIKLTNRLTEVSFNALVQGFLTDKVAQAARELGMTNALLHLGESYAIGKHPEGRDWSLAVMGTPHGEEVDLVGTMEFADAGLAVSTHDTSRKLVNPLTGEVLQHDRVVAVVSSEGATVADAFATAFAVANKSQWEQLYDSLTLNKVGVVKVWQKNQLVFERA